MKYIKLFILFIGLAYYGTAQAQHRATPKPQPVAKFKPPVLTTFLGIYKDTSIVPAREAAGLVALPLRVTDAKNNIYTVTYYEFIYRQLAVTEDDSMSGKPSLTTSQRYVALKTTPLPLLWLNAAREDPRAGDEYIFFDIIVKDAQGRLMYAPNLNLKLK